MFVLRAEIVTIFELKMVTISARNTNIFYFFSTFLFSINGNLVHFMKNKLSGIRPDNSNYPAGYRIVRFCHNPAGLSGILYPVYPYFAILLISLCSF